MLDVDPQHVLELSLARDQDQSRQSPADGADPPLGKRVRLQRPEWRADDLDAFASEDLAVDIAELAVAVVGQGNEMASGAPARDFELWDVVSYRRRTNRTRSGLGTRRTFRRRMDSPSGRKRLTQLGLG
jgi:hypothetical protein